MFVAAVTGLILTGAIQQFDDTQRFELAAAADGSFDFRKEGPAGERLVWNGRAGWRVAPDGRVQPLDLYDLESTRLAVWLMAGRRLEWPVNLAADSLSLPQGRLVASVSRDGNGAVNQASWPCAAGLVTWVLNDKPGHTGPGFEESTWVQTVEDTPVELYRVRTSQAAELDPSRFTEPPRPADDWTWLSDAPDTLELKQAATGHLLVRPRLNGREPGWFIFDTGAGESTVAATVAAELGLPTVGHTILTSFLSSVEAAVHQVDTLDIGPLRLTDRRLVAMDLTPLEPVLGVPLAGVIGGEVLNRALVAVETALPRITILRPGAHPIDAAAWRPLRFHHRLPIVAADFAGGTEELFRIDVGAAGPGFGHVAFHPPAVARLKLLEGLDWERHTAAGMTVAIGPIEWFDLAGHRFVNEPVAMVESAEGPMADPWVAGNIGVELLKPFTVVFDFANRRIAFVPRDGK